MIAFYVCEGCKQIEMQVKTVECTPNTNDLNRLPHDNVVLIVLDKRMHQGNNFSYFFMKTCFGYSLEAPWQDASN